MSIMNPSYLFFIGELKTDVEIEPIGEGNRGMDCWVITPKLGLDEACLETIIQCLHDFGIPSDRVYLADHFSGILVKHYRGEAFPINIQQAAKSFDFNVFEVESSEWSNWTSSGFVKLGNLTDVTSARQLLDIMWTQEFEKEYLQYLNNEEAEEQHMVDKINKLSMEKGGHTVCKDGEEAEEEQAKDKAFALPIRTATTAKLASGYEQNT